MNRTEAIGKSIRLDLVSVERTLQQQRENSKDGIRSIVLGIILICGYCARVPDPIHALPEALNVEGHGINGAPLMHPSPVSQRSILQLPHNYSQIIIGHSFVVHPSSDLP